MSAKRKTVDVSILGRTYKVACAEEEREALQTAVEYLDHKMQEIKRAGKVASAERIAVMAALNITNELLSSDAERKRVDTDALKGRMQIMQAMLDELLAVRDGQI